MWASGTATPAAGAASLQVQAQELAGQIEADGRTLDELDAAYNGAQIRLQSLDTRIGSLQARMQHTAGLVSQARRTLKEQAILAYVNGGAPLVYLPDHPGQDPSLTVAYAEIIAGGQERAAAHYRSDLRSMTDQATALRATQQQADVTLAAIRTDQAHAAVAMASQRQALAQVKGQMAVLVAQVEQAQQQAEQAQLQAQQSRTRQTQPASTSGATEGYRTSGYSSPLPPTAGPADPSAEPTGPPPTPRPPTGPTVGTQPAPTATSTTTTPPTTTDPAAGPGTTGTTGGPGTTGGTGTTGSTRAVPPQAPGAGAALTYARAQLGKPYQWAGAGPNSFDCSGLVMMAWEQGGVQFPHLAQDQYDMTARIPVSQALPGDLIFFGTPNNVYHVGIYIGNGQMIDAPETGQNVSIQSIYWSSLLGAGRVYS